MRQDRRKKLPLTVREALEQGIIERYYRRCWRRYFFAICGGQDGFETGTQALQHYFEISLPHREALERQDLRQKARSGKYLVGLRHKDRVSVWDGKACVFDGSMRQFRQEVFGLEERCGKEVVWP